MGVANRVLLGRRPWSCWARASMQMAPGEPVERPLITDNYLG